MTVFSSIYDTATPLGTDAPSTLDDQDRLTKGAVQERENVDHYWPLTGTQVSGVDVGEHRKATFHEPLGADPTTATNKGHVYMKNVAGVVELFWKDESGNVLQLTTGGKLNIGSSDIVGKLANNTFFTAVDQAGTGTVNLIKANASDVAVIPDGSEMATSGAPTSDADISNKKYVDDHTTMVPAVTGAGTGYTGQESTISANGEIFKRGVIAKGATPTIITFAEAFPNGIISANVTSFKSGQLTSGGALTAYSISALSAISDGTVPSHFHWQAWGH